MDPDDPHGPPPPPLTGPPPEIPSAGALLTRLAQQRRMNEAVMPRAHPTIEQMDTLFANEIMADLIAQGSIPADDVPRYIEASPEIVPLIEKRQREIAAAAPAEEDDPPDAEPTPEA